MTEDKKVPIDQLEGLDPEGNFVAEKSSDSEAPITTDAATTAIDPAAETDSSSKKSEAIMALGVSLMQSDQIRLTTEECTLNIDREEVNAYVKTLTQAPAHTKVALFNTTRGDVPSQFNFLQKGKELGLRQIKRGSAEPISNNPCLGVVPMTNWGLPQTVGFAYFIPKDEIALPGEELEGKRVQLGENGVAGITGSNERSFLSLLDVEGRVVVGPETVLTADQENQITKFNEWVKQSYEKLSDERKKIDVLQNLAWSAVKEYWKQVPQKLEEILFPRATSRAVVSEKYFSLEDSFLKECFSVTDVLNGNSEKEIAKVTDRITISRDNIVEEQKRLLASNQQHLGQLQAELLSGHELLNDVGTRGVTSLLRQRFQKKQHEQGRLKEITTFLEGKPGFSWPSWYNAKETSLEIVKDNILSKYLKTLEEQTIEMEQNVEEIPRTIGKVEKLAENSLLLLDQLNDEVDKFHPKVQEIFT